MGSQRVGHNWALFILELLGYERYRHGASEAALPLHEESLPGHGAKVRKAEPRGTAGGVAGTPSLCCT